MSGYTKLKRSAGSHSKGLDRVLSKLGFCSRSQARRLIAEGRVTVNDQVRRDVNWQADADKDRLAVDGQPVRTSSKVYLMLNKPRGLVTSASDEQGRATVFSCLVGKGWPHVVPVGRLDKASEGLLLFTNDTEWAASITDPASHLEKVYHVQVNCLADEALAQRMQTGIQQEGDLLAAKRASLLRRGEKNSWIEVVLDEGKNRHIRRLLDELGIEVLRLVRVAIGGLQLGELAKGQVRELTPEEVKSLSRTA